MIPKTIIHCLSGGLDSTVMLYDLHNQGHRIHCLLFDYRQRHKQELQWAKYHASICGVKFTTVDLPDLGGAKKIEALGVPVVAAMHGTVMVFLGVVPLAVGAFGLARRAAAEGIGPAVR